MASEPSYVQRVRSTLRVAVQETRRRPGIYFGVILALAFPVGLVAALYGGSGLTVLQWLALATLVVVQVELWVWFSLAVRQADNNLTATRFVDDADSSTADEP